MSKIAVFKFDHCCLCPQNEMRYGDGENEFWCKLKNMKLNDEGYADFPDWCPKPEAKTLIDPANARDLEGYLNERII